MDEDVAIKAAGVEPASGFKEEVVSSVPQADMSKQPESFAFWQAEPLKEVSTPSVGVKSKQGMGPADLYLYTVRCVAEFTWWSIRSDLLCIFCLIIFALDLDRITLLQPHTSG